MPEGIGIAVYYGGLAIGFLLASVLFLFFLQKRGLITITIRPSGLRGYASVLALVIFFIIAYRKLDPKDPKFDPKYPWIYSFVVVAFIAFFFLLGPLASGYVAYCKNRSRLGWVLLSLVFGSYALLLLMGLRAKYSGLFAGLEPLLDKCSSRLQRSRFLGRDSFSGRFQGHPVALSMGERRFKLMLSCNSPFSFAMKNRKRHIDEILRSAFITEPSPRPQPVALELDEKFLFADVDERFYFSVASPNLKTANVSGWVQHDKIRGALESLFDHCGIDSLLVGAAVDQTSAIGDPCLQASYLRYQKKNFKPSTVQTALQQLAVLAQSLESEVNA